MRLTAFFSRMCCGGPVFVLSIALVSFGGDIYAALCGRTGMGIRGDGDRHLRSLQAIGIQGRRSTQCDQVEVGHSFGQPGAA